MGGLLGGLVEGFPGGLLEGQLEGLPARLLGDCTAGGRAKPCGRACQAMR